MSEALLCAGRRRKVNDGERRVGDRRESGRGGGRHAFHEARGLPGGGRDTHALDLDARCALRNSPASTDPIDRFHGAPQPQLSAELPGHPARQGLEPLTEREKTAFARA